MFGVCLVFSCRSAFLVALMRRYNTTGQALKDYPRAAANCIIEWVLLLSCLFLIPLVKASLNPTDHFTQNVMLVFYLWLIGTCSSFCFFWYGSHVNPETIESITFKTYDLPGPAGGWVPYLTPKILWRDVTLHSKVYRVLNFVTALVLFSLAVFFLLQLVPYHHLL